MLQSLLAERFQLAIRREPKEIPVYALVVAKNGDTQAAMFQALGVPEGFGAPVADPSGPSLFAALEEQLGLRLDSQKGPVETFTIERIERPSEN
jgi:hypothetical protein